LREIGQPLTRFTRVSESAVRARASPVGPMSKAAALETRTLVSDEGSEKFLAVNIER
jgi:hypothetical protein